ncbi:hypothetical protein BH23GEM9_BH23GEM9_27070 [soil metagenome]
MPQPVLHLILASETLEKWERTPAASPFDPHSAAARNAFLNGCLGPDLGLFPGGETAFSRLAHRQSTAALAGTLMTTAVTAPETAFAWGWLSHMLADIAIHPLVNDAAAVLARRDGSFTLADHVRVEVGLDAWFARQAGLRHLRLSPAFDRAGAEFVCNAFASTYRHAVSPLQLLRMQAGMIRFTHLALHFATSVAGEVCWREREADSGYAFAPRARMAGTARVSAPLASVVLWRVITLLASRRSMVHAYLNPIRPAPPLLHGVVAAMEQYHVAMAAHVRSTELELPDHDLETGAPLRSARDAY